MDLTEEEDEKKALTSFMDREASVDDGTWGVPMLGASKLAATFIERVVLVYEPIQIICFFGLDFLDFFYFCY